MYTSVHGIAMHNPKPEAPQMPITVEWKPVISSYNGIPLGNENEQTML